MFVLDHFFGGTFLFELRRTVFYALQGKDERPGSYESLLAYFPCSANAFWRLSRAGAKSGLISNAVWKWAMPSSILPLRTSAMPMLVWTSASWG